MISSEHRRPLAAFLLVFAFACVVMANGLREQVVRVFVDSGGPRPLISAVVPDIVLGSSLHDAPRHAPVPTSDAASPSPQTQPLVPHRATPTAPTAPVTSVRPATTAGHPRPHRAAPPQHHKAKAKPVHVAQAPTAPPAHHPTPPAPGTPTPVTPPVTGGPKGNGVGNGVGNGFGSGGVRGQVKGPNGLVAGGATSRPGRPGQSGQPGRPGHSHHSWAPAHHVALQAPPSHHGQSGQRSNGVARTHQSRDRGDHLGRGHGAAAHQGGWSGHGHGSPWGAGGPRGAHGQGGWGGAHGAHGQSGWGGPHGAHGQGRHRH